MSNTRDTRVLEPTEGDSLFAAFARSALKSSASLAYVRRDQVEELTHVKLLNQARSVAAHIQEYSDVRPGAVALLAASSPLHFAAGFFGSLAAGLVPAPAPSRLGQESHVARLRTMIRSASPAILLTTADVEQAVRTIADDHNAPYLVLDDCLTNQADLVDAASADAAFVQYTSGSISAPKPVIVSHRNALAHLAQARAAYEESSASVSVNWVPVFHDMGLMTSLLRPILGSYRSVILDPHEFVASPSRWLRAIGDHGGTHTSSPNFGYDLCTRRIPSHERFDLRSLQVARNAGELVRAETMRQFARRFGPHGLRREVFSPSYGMAEATLTVTTVGVHEQPKTLLASSDALRQGVFVEATDRCDTTEVVSCGPPLPGTTVLITEQGRAVADGRIGEVVVAGPQVVVDGGEVDRRSADDPPPCHRTGDLGFRIDGELYLVGRAHERISHCGQNFYPPEIELAVAESVDELRRGRVAICQLRSAQDASKVAIAAELSTATNADEVDELAIARRIIHIVGRRFSLPLDRVYLCAAGSLPVTTSGKIQRLLCADEIETGALTHRFLWAC